MNIVIATDKFKHSLSAFQVCAAITKGLTSAYPGVSIKALPLADGGDGLSDIMAYYLPLRKNIVPVLDPLFRQIEASYLSSTDNHLSVIEMAKASGLQLLQPGEYNCAATTSYGTGQLLKEAVNKGAAKIIVGIGGSATNDCGIGMAVATGYRFLDKYGKELAPVGRNLRHIHNIDASQRVGLGEISIEVACDVTNYLTGTAGATFTYGPQKGATAAELEDLEEGMISFSGIVRKELGVDMQAIKGGGAAGGMGAGCVAFLGADLVNGAELVFKYSNAEEEIKNADVVVTGEGKIDEQTLHGKLVCGVGQLCKKYGKPLVALCGTLDLDSKRLKEAGLTAAFSILNKPSTHAEAFQQAFFLLSETSYNIAGLLKEMNR